VPHPARRRVLRGGLASGPVLLTFASRPVLGGQCVTASASTSLNASRAATSYATCSGRSPTTWASTSPWPIPYYATTKHGSNGYAATPYHCTTTGLGGTTFSLSTMRDVMLLTDDGNVRSLGRYIAAALLNAKLGLTPVLTETMVRIMWNDYLLKSYFEPTAGIRWGPPEIVRYIQATIA
jgi:hypothetical protein